MITREMVEARLADLHKQQEQAVANLNALHGAVQATEYWLSVIDQQDKPTDPDLK